MTDRIDIAPVTALPEKAEPEEAPARRVLDLPMTVDVGFTPWDPNKQVVAQGFAPVTTDMPAGEMAQAVSTLCAHCIHFRQDVWQATRKNWEATKRETLNRMILTAARSGIAESRDPTIEELNEASLALNGWGVCAALTETKNDVVLVHPMGGCPEGVEFFKARDRASKRESSAAFDNVMHRAMGRR